MYKRVKKAKLGRKKSHKDMLRRNLLRSLFDNNTVTTTTTKAKVLKQDASSLIEKGLKRKEDLSFKREVIVLLQNESIVNKYYEYLKMDKPAVKLVKVGFRGGDNAEMSKVTLAGKEKKKIVKKVEKEQESTEKKAPKEKQEVKVKEDKRVDKTAVIKKVGRSTSRSGL